MHLIEGLIFSWLCKGMRKMSVRNLDDDWLFCDPTQVGRHGGAKIDKTSAQRNRENPFNTAHHAVTNIESSLYLIGAGFLVGLGTAVLCASLVMMLAALS